VQATRQLLLSESEFLSRQAHYSAFKPAARWRIGAGPVEKVERVVHRRILREPAAALAIIGMHAFAS
jgi:hypothetical protein